MSNETLDSISSWQQGAFIPDRRALKNMSEKERQMSQFREEHLVRPAPKSNAICECQLTEDAIWIAARLNLASDIEKAAKSAADCLRNIESASIKGAIEKEFLRDVQRMIKDCKLIYKEQEETPLGVPQSRKWFTL
jgi:hypothetical protein